MPDIDLQDHEHDCIFCGIFLMRDERIVGLCSLCQQKRSNPQPVSDGGTQGDIAKCCVQPQI